VRIKRAPNGFYGARVMGALDLPLNDGPELLRRRYIRDLATATRAVAALLGQSQEQTTFVVEA